MLLEPNFRSIKPKLRSLKRKLRAINFGLRSLARLLRAINFRPTASFSSASGDSHPPFPPASKGAPRRTKIHAYPLPSALYRTTSDAYLIWFLLYRTKIGGYLFSSDKGETKLGSYLFALGKRRTKKAKLPKVPRVKNHIDAVGIGSPLPEATPCLEKRLSLYNYRSRCRGNAIFLYTRQANSYTGARC